MAIVGKYGIPNNSKIDSIRVNIWQSEAAAAAAKEPAQK
jgi:hypothetical protein